MEKRMENIDQIPSPCIGVCCGKWLTGLVILEKKNWEYWIALNSDSPMLAWTVAGQQGVSNDRNADIIVK